jgi:hypothetical protein
MQKGVLIIAWESDDFEKWLASKECQVLFYDVAGKK